ncbi:hypothetical protein Efla_003113 [Eimeria flavescens]
MATQLLRRTEGDSAGAKCCCGTEGLFQCEEISPAAARSSPEGVSSSSTCDSCADNTLPDSGYGLTGRLDITSSVGQSRVVRSSAAGVSNSSLNSTFVETAVDSLSKDVYHLSPLKVDASGKSKSSLTLSHSLHAGPTCMEDASSKAHRSNMQCLVCGELGGALMCHDCSSRGSCFFNRYRTSYLYATLDSGVKVASQLGQLFAADSRLLKGCSSTVFAAVKAVLNLTGRSNVQPQLTQFHVGKKSRSAQLRRSGKGSCRKRQAPPKPASLKEGLEVEQPSQAVQPAASGRAEGRMAPQVEGVMQSRHFQDLNQASNNFWAKVNILEVRALALVRQHQLLIWTVWALLSLGFFCGLNCVLWPILAMLFILRQLRILFWETAVRRLGSHIFSSDFESLVVKRKASAGRRLSPLDLKEALGRPEILSLMEGQEKLFFSMPWMAVTAFSYCESLTLAGLSTAITKNLLRPREEFAEVFEGTEGIDVVERLPLSAFLHPRLLTRVQRIMGRYCWVRQQGFHVSQQVIKLTKKGLDLLRQQRLREGQNGQDTSHLDYVTGASCEAKENLCSCACAAECNCLMDESDVIYLMNESLAQPLDPQKPLWQFVVLENVLLPRNVVDGSSTKQRIGSAVIFRLHHAVGDGISATRMFLKDFLRTAPTVTDSSTKPKSHLDTEAWPADFCSKGLGARNANSLQHDHSRCAVAESEEALLAGGGSPVSVASTSTTWAPSGPSLKASSEAIDANEKIHPHGHTEAPLPSVGQGVAPLKPSVSVCTLPDGILWKILVAVRFALELPFYAAAMVLLSRYDGLVDAPRSGSASKTRISRPICLPLQHMKDLKERLVLALTERREQQLNERKQHDFKQLSTPLQARQGQQQGVLLQKFHGQQSAKIRDEREACKKGERTVVTPSQGCTAGSKASEATTIRASPRITLNDLFASCIVGGYHRCAALAKSELCRGRSDSGGSRSADRFSWKEDINFVVPVNLRRREEDAKHLRNRFASLVINLPVNPQLGSLERMRGVHYAMRRTLHSFALPMIMCLERWLYVTWPDLLMVFFLRLTRKISVIFSSVIGPATLPYVHGSRVHSMHFVVPQPGEARRPSACSAGGSGGFGIFLRRKHETVVKDPRILRKCIIDEYKSLCHACKDFEPLDI